MEIKVDYMAIDVKVKTVIVTAVFTAEQYIMCDLYGETGSLVCHNACYWFDGVNKNIPFKYTAEA